MTGRITILNGSNWADGEVLYAADLNNTIGSSYEYTANVQLYNQTKIIKSNSVFTSEFGLFVENFTDYNGVNNTLFSGTSVTSAYYNAGSAAYVNASIIGSSAFTGGNSNTSTLLHQNMTARVWKSTGYVSNISFIGATSSPASGLINTYVTKNGSIIGSDSRWVTSGATAIVTLNPPSDLTLLLSSGDTMGIIISGTSNFAIRKENSTLQISGAFFSGAAQLIGYTTSGAFTFYEYKSAGSLGTVTCGSTLYTKDGNLNNLKIFADSIIPTGASINVDVTASGITISGIQIDPITKTTNFTNISGLGLGFITLKFNLNSSGTNYPLLKGFSGMVQK
jgi:hypothetical protein